MILNRLIFPEGNTIEFRVFHKQNGEEYVPDETENYYIIISQASQPFSTVLSASSENSFFSFESNLSAGEYVFEIGITDSSGNRKIILPALDERLKPLNHMLILRRLENE